MERQSDSARPDVLIIGAGMAGLTAAAYLARAGTAVTVLERSQHVGGRAATRDENGFCFNHGVHALYSGGAASRVLTELGVSYGFGIPKATFGLYQGSIHTVPISPFALLRTDLVDLGGKLEFMRLLAALSRVQSHTLAGQSVQDWLEHAVRRENVRRILTAFACTFVYSSALDLVSAEVFVDKLKRSLRHPIHYIDGGWQTLVDGVRRAAEQAGARIEPGTSVSAIEHDGVAMGAVRLDDGRSIRAGSVVLAVTPPEAVKLLGEPQALRARVDALLAAPVACLDLALSRLPVSEHPIVWDLNRPLFMTAQSVYARVAPVGNALVHLFKQLDPRDPPDQSADERELEAFMDAAQPGWRELVVKRIFLPRIGAVGALPTASTGGFAGRPGVHAAGIANLCLAGDWIGAEGFLVDASMASAREAALAIMHDHAAGASRPSLVA